MPNLSSFDATFFGVSGKAAHKMDPQLRLLLHVTYEAIADAGWRLDEVAGSNTGVFVAGSFSDSHFTLLEDEEEITGYEHTGCLLNMFSNRLSYFLDVSGPSLTVDTACSSAMVAVSMALAAIASGECDRAIVGGVNVQLIPTRSVAFAKLNMLSPDGACKAFDASANGYARAEGIAAIVLDKHSLARNVYASLLAARTNNDGYTQEGITYPSSAAQELLLAQVMADAGVTPDQVVYVEAHGTGTQAGDTVEVNVVDNVYVKNIPARSPHTPLLIGSVKSNMGHCENVSGLAGLIKVCLAARAGLLPPNIHYSQPNPKIPALLQGSIRVVTSPTPWEGGIVGVSSFGFGGSNAHCLLSVPPPPPSTSSTTSSHDGDTWHFIPIASRTRQGLQSLHQEVQHLMTTPSAPAVHAKLHSLFGPGSALDPRLKHSGCVIIPPSSTPLSTLGASHGPAQGSLRPSTYAFVFNGMGTQWVGMMKGVAQHYPIVAITLAQVVATLEELEAELSDPIPPVLLPSRETGDTLFDHLSQTDLEDPLVGYVTLTAAHVSLWRLLHSLGLDSPVKVFGHSAGEIGAAVAAGALSVPQATQVAFWRGMAARKATAECPGAMLAVGLSWEDAQESLAGLDSVWVACHNGPTSTTLSGTKDGIEQIKTALTQKGVFVRDVNSSGVAFHTPLVAPASSLLRSGLGPVLGSGVSPSSSFVSTSAPPVCDNDAPLVIDAEYFVTNFEAPVRFARAVDQIDPQTTTVIEIGPSSTFVKLLSRALGPGSRVIGLTRKDFEPPVAPLVAGLGYLGLLPPPVQDSDVPCPRISSLVSWNTKEWQVVRHVSARDAQSGTDGWQVVVDLNSGSEWEWLAGHAIDGRVLFPGTGYAALAWYAALMATTRDAGTKPETDGWRPPLGYRLQDFAILRPLVMSTAPGAGPWTLSVSSLSGSGAFEVVSDGHVLARGRMEIVDHQEQDEASDGPDGETVFDWEKDGVYRSLALKGYGYGGEFKSVLEATEDGKVGRVGLAGVAHGASVADVVRAVTVYTDAALQLVALASKDRVLRVPTRIRSLEVDPSVLLVRAKEDQASLIVTRDDVVGVVKGPGMELRGFEWGVAPRRPSPEAVKLQYAFVELGLGTPLSLETALAVALEPYSEGVCLVRPDDQESGRVADIRSCCGRSLQVAVDQDAGASGAGGVVAWAEVFAEAEGGVVDWISGLGDEVRGVVISSASSLPLSLPKEVEGWVWMNGTTGCHAVLKRVVRSSADVRVVDGTGLVDGGRFEVFRDELVSVLEDGEEERDVVVVVREEEGGLGLARCFLKEAQLFGWTRVSFGVVASGGGVEGVEEVVAGMVRGGGSAVSVGVFGRAGGEVGVMVHRSLVVASTEGGTTDGGTTDGGSRKRRYVDVGSRGDLSTLTWYEDGVDVVEVEASGASEVEVAFGALNFKDVMLAVGKLSKEVAGHGLSKGELGFEFSGRVGGGQRGVMGIGPRALATKVWTREAFLWDVPEGMTLASAATIPVVYATAYYSLVVRARLGPGMSVLIHSGTGGVGQAAIRVAHSLGATVYTTVGTTEKRDLVSRLFPEIPDSRIGDSRSVSFEEMVMRGTEGAGVDVVLNSLAGDKLAASLRCVKAHGSFVEIGKYDLMLDTPIGLGVFVRNTSFHGVDLDQVMDDGQAWSEVHALVSSGLDSGVVVPLATTVFSGDDVESAFRYMASGKHTGKVVIDVEGVSALGDTAVVSKTNPVARFTSSSPSGEGVLVSGGLGGLGLEIARWLVVDQGVRRVVLLSRSGVRTGYQRVAVGALEEAGAEVVVGQVDVGDEDALRAFAASCDVRVGAVIHAAGVLADATFERTSQDDVDRAWHAKVRGAVSLGSVYSGASVFLGISSVVAGMGNAGQTAYAMANAGMEAVVAGLEGGVVVQLGAVAEVGMLEGVSLDGFMVGGQRVSEVVVELGSALASGSGVRTVFVRGERGERSGSGADGSLADRVAVILGFGSASELDVNAPLQSLGLDSIMVTELQKVVSGYGVVLKVSEVGGMSISELEAAVGPAAAASATGSRDSGDGGGGSGGEEVMEEGGDEVVVEEGGESLPSQSQSPSPSSASLSAAPSSATPSSATPSSAAPSSAASLSALPSASIMGLGYAVPETYFSAEEFVDNMVDLFEMAEVDSGRLKRIVSNSSVMGRFTVLSDWRSFFNNLEKDPSEKVEERDGLYRMFAPKLAARAAEAALEDWGGDKGDITHVIGVSCTGVLNPGLAYEVIQELELAPSTQRLSVLMMGCFGGHSGIKTARAIAALSPRNRVLVVCCELCTLHMQLDPRVDNIVAAAIFGDGASAVVIGSPQSCTPPERRIYDILATEACTIPGTRDMMTWNRSANGMVVELSADIPEQIEGSVGLFVTNLLMAVPGISPSFDPRDALWPLHPGGIAIIKGIERTVGLTEAHTQSSRAVLARQGNVSSGTVLCVLDHLRRAAGEEDVGKLCVSLSFGPGLCIEGCVLRYLGNEQ